MPYRRSRRILCLVPLILGALHLPTPATAGGTGEKVEQVESVQIPKVQEQQQKLLDQLRKELSVLDQRAAASESESSEARERLDRLRALHWQLGETEKRINSESKPATRTRYVSPFVADRVFRDYYRRVCARIEDFSTKNFPMDDGAKVHGIAVLLVTIQKDGRVDKIEVTVPSSSKTLTDHAVRIVRALAPFEPFPTDVAAEADRLVLAANFNYRGPRPSAAEPGRPEPSPTDGPLVRAVPER
jgi:periplasmic protein TonB